MQREKDQFFIFDADGCLLEICPDFDSFPLALDIRKTPIHEKKIDRAYYLDGILYYVDMENRFYSYRMKDRQKSIWPTLPAGWINMEIFPASLCFIPPLTWFSGTGFC